MRKPGYGNLLRFEIRRFGEIVMRVGQGFPGSVLTKFSFNAKFRSGAPMFRAGLNSPLSGDPFYCERTLPKIFRIDHP